MGDPRGRLHGPRVSTSPEVLKAFPEPNRREEDPFKRKYYRADNEGFNQTDAPPPPTPAPKSSTTEPPPLKTATTEPPRPPAPPASPTVVVDLDGLAQTICACLAEQTKQLLAELPDKIAERVEQRLVTSRGIVVAPPPTCAQPVGGTDIDDQVIKVALPGTDAVGTRHTILKRTATRSTVIKGINWFFAIDKSVGKLADPTDQIACSILVNGNPVGNTPQAIGGLPTTGTRTHGAYSQQRIPPAPGGIQALGASQIYVESGDTVELVAERMAHTSGTAVDFQITARWKGWDWTPTVNAPGATGAGGF